MIVNDLADPAVLFLELIAWIGHLEAVQQKERNGKFGDRSSERDAANPDVVFRAQQKKREDAQERQKRDDRQQMGLRFHVYCTTFVQSTSKSTVNPTAPITTHAA